jgi:CheY-like chemotaxis protein/HPt (histidine-containing phosphotransfer) domain-containing protein
LARAKGRRVLLAEDNEINQLVATEILSRSGIRCDVVGTGRAAVDAVAAGGYDLVLMDCQMPEMDGFEASRLIRQREAREAAGRQGELRQAAAQLSSAPSSSPSRAGLPIVALTANAIKGDRERCLAAGMDGYLTKPINPTKLIETILSFLPEAPAAGPSGADETNPEAAVAAAPHPATEPAWTAPAGPPVVDLAAVMTRCLNNAGLVAKLLAKFDGQLRQDVDALEKRLAAGDGGEESVRLAHGLKGVAASMAADGVRRAAAEAEQRLRQGDVAGARQSVAVLKQEAQRCLDGLPAVQARAAALAPPPARAKAS